jgi:Tfp pilus assembly protein PilF
VLNAPSRVDARAALVRALIAGGDVTRAQEELRRLRQIAPDTAEENELQGLLYVQAGNRAAARKSFDRALERDPESFSALVSAVRLAFARRDAASVRARVEDRLSRDPDNPSLLLMAARIRLATGDATGAESLLRHSIAVDLMDTANFALLSQIYIDQHRRDEARREFDAIAAADPGNVSARTMAALLVHAAGDTADAAARYEAVLEAEPRLTVAANNLASIYADSGENLDRAQQLAETAVEQLPANADLIDTLGWVYYKRAQPGRAVTQFQQSVAAVPDKPDFHYHLGLAYAKTGDEQRAREALQAALKLNPNFKAARDALSSLRPPS